MRFLTKYNIGDTVYFMKNNRIHKGDISLIRCTKYRQNGQIMISYEVGREEYYQHFVFKTTEELLKTL